MDKDEGIRGGKNMRHTEEVAAPVSLDEPTIDLLPLLYTDTLGGRQTCRDDLWVITTAERDRVIESLRRLREREWVPVGERLPEIGKRVQIVCEDYEGDPFVTNATMNGYKKKPHFVMDGGKDAVNATHWKPLDAAPKERT